MADEEGEQFHFDPSTYLQMMSDEVPGYRELQRLTAEATAGAPADSILELGVGTGETSVAVTAVFPGARFTGIDESAAMLAQARQRLPAADLRVQRLEDPLPEGSYDLIVSALTIHHLDGPQKEDLFHRVADRLRPGGRFVLADVVVPDDPTQAVTPVDNVYDRPSRLEDQLGWIEAAGLHPRVFWAEADLAVVVCESPSILGP